MQNLYKKFISGNQEKSYRGLENWESGGGDLEEENLKQKYWGN